MPGGIIKMLNCQISKMQLSKLTSAEPSDYLILQISHIAIFLHNGHVICVKDFEPETARFGDEPFFTFGCKVISLDDVATCILMRVVHGKCGEAHKLILKYVVVPNLLKGNCNFCMLQIDILALKGLT
jgi:hypothetical protein